MRRAKSSSMRRFIGLHEFQPISERIMYVDPPEARQGIIVNDFVTCVAALRGQAHNVRYEKCRMCLPRGPEIRIDSEMKLYPGFLEPCTTPFCQLGRLGDFLEFEDPCVKFARLALSAGRHC